jgi:hypothetical protein
MKALSNPYQVYPLRVYPLFELQQQQARENTGAQAIKNGG